MLDGDPDHPPHDETLLARYPHASALGKLLLADQADWRVVVRGLRQLTTHTIIDADRLDAELARCRQDRLARQCGELRPDRGCLAVPIHDVTDGTLIAGLALSGPPDRVAEPNAERRTDRPAARTRWPACPAAGLNGETGAKTPNQLTPEPWGVPAFANWSRYYESSPHTATTGEAQMATAGRIC